MYEWTYNYMCDCTEICDHVYIHVGDYVMAFTCGLTYEHSCVNEYRSNFMWARSCQFNVDILVCMTVWVSCDWLWMYICVKECVCILAHLIMLMWSCSFVWMNVTVCSYVWLNAWVYSWGVIVGLYVYIHVQVGMNAWPTVSLCVREYHSVHVCEYMYECECMWVCLCANDCESRSLCLPVCKHVLVCDWVNIHVHVCMFIHVNMWTWCLSDLQVYIWAYLFQWIYKYVSVQAYSCVSECECIRSFVWMYQHVCLWKMCKCVHTCEHAEREMKSMSECVQESMCKNVCVHLKSWK